MTGLRIKKMIKILTVDNTVFSMNDIPDEIEDLRYCVLDYSNVENVDYHFIPLVFLESFSTPAADLRIGKYRIQVPLDWSVVIGDKNSGDLEIISIKHINDRTFEVFCMNPINGYMPSFEDIEIMDIFPDIRWYVPQLKYGHLLLVPLNNTKSPLCAFFVKDVNKLPEILDITKMV